MNTLRHLDPKNSYAFSKVFGKQEEITLPFLNALLQLEEKERIVSIEFLDSSDGVDLLVEDRQGAQYIVVLHMAPSHLPTPLSAAQRYCAHYSKASKVTSLTISNSLLFPQKIAHTSTHHLLDIHDLQRDLPHFSFTFIELPKFTKTFEELTTPADQWLFFLKHGGNPSLPEITRATHELRLDNWALSDLLAYEHASRHHNEQLKVLQVAKREGKEEGLAEGEAVGLAVGLKKGIEEGMRRMAHRLFKKGLPLHEICGLTLLPEQEVRSLLAPSLSPFNP